ncbi:hypothetical protein [Actinomadura keratinilytica]|jgi:hypothetical protein|uniref:Secreted protein n=1 Tax=Actinomadura keratinilytica TaxID=547461 RepID=A0ABP7YNZ1_9ACTN
MTTPPTSPPAVAAAGGAPAPPAGPAARRPRRFRVAGIRTIPGRIRVYTGGSLLSVVLLLGVTMAAVGNARDGVQTIGHDAGPQVMATGTLYFALSDMDAQVADILLIGREHDLGIGRAESLRRYEQRRAEANQAAVQAAQIAGRDEARRRTVREVLDGLGRYERLVGEAMLLDRQSAHPAGELPQNVVDTYRRATDLMKMELLPRAYNLTLDSGATVRQSYETDRDAVLDGRLRVGLAGALALALLIALQVYLAGRFRRLVNPALALATVLTLAVVAAGMAMLSAQAGHLQRAKEEGFDSILALNRARAISHSAFADESRYLLDPGRADTYEQVFLDKALSVLYVDPGERPLNLETYYDLLPGAVRSYERDPSGPPVEVLGLFGEEKDKNLAEFEESRLRLTVQAYQRVMDNDRRMRELAAAGDRRAAIELRMGRQSGAITAFDTYDQQLTLLIQAHRDEFDRAVRAGDDGLGGWDVLPPAAALAVAGLILAGVRPRLAEFR